MQLSSAAGYREAVRSSVVFHVVPCIVVHRDVVTGDVQLVSVEACASQGQTCSSLQAQRWSSSSFLKNVHSVVVPSRHPGHCRGTSRALVVRRMALRHSHLSRVDVCIGTARHMSAEPITCVWPNYGFGVLQGRLTSL